MTLAREFSLLPSQRDGYTTGAAALGERLCATSGPNDAIDATRCDVDLL